MVPNTILYWKILFDILQLLKDCAKEENKIKKNLPNLNGGTRLRSTRSNNMFMHHFVGLCVWKNMNEGKCWMAKNDLDPMKELNNIKQIKGCINYLCKNKNVLRRHLLMSGELSIYTHKVHSFCANVRNTYKNGVWDLKSRNIVSYLDHFMLC